MPLDDLKCEKGVEYTKKIFFNQFLDSIELISEKMKFEHHGWFVIELLYLPKQYNIKFEHDLGVFSIRIEDSDGGFISLGRIFKHNNELNKDNIIEAIRYLGNFLENNDNIEFYKTNSNKIYKNINGSYKRIKGYDRR